MSAGTHAYVSCNGHDGNHRYCTERIDEGATKAEARRVARSRGWLTSVYSNGTKPYKGGPLGLFDFCPAHKPVKERRDG